MPSVVDRRRVAAFRTDAPPGKALEVDGLAAMGDVILAVRDTEGNLKGTVEVPAAGR